MWLLLRQPLEPPVFQPPHSDQDIYIWPDAAEVWYARVDAQFAIRNVSSSKTKFYHAVAVLPQEVATQILDLI